MFENGDILIVEQNTPLSGVGGGHIDTWNYRVVNKQSQSDMGFVYAYPDDKEMKAAKE